MEFYCSVAVRLHTMHRYSVFVYLSVVMQQRGLRKLDSPESESRWGRDFPHPSKPALGHTKLSIK